MEVPFVDVKQQTKIYKKEYLTAINTVLDKSNYILGDEVKVFEDKFKSYIGTKFAIGVANGTDALHLALLESGIKKGDEVIVPVNTYIATALAVIYCGAKPVFVDIDLSSYNLDVKELENVITKNTKAIIPVHLYGQAAEMEKIITFANNHELIIIEDASQAHGAKYKGITVGNFSKMACFSLYPGKNLGALGDGGIITTDNETSANNLRALRNYGQHIKHKSDLIGYNSRLDTIQSAILIKKIEYLQEWTLKRQKAAAKYSNILSDYLPTPIISDNCEHVFHIYVIQISEREKFMGYMEENQIFCNIHYPIPLHLQPCMKFLGYKKGDFPNVESICDNIVSLPIFPEISTDQIDYTCSKIKSYLKR